MEYDISALKKEVRVVMDHNMIDSQLTGLSEVNTLSLDEIIESAIPRAARLIEENAPIHLLDGALPLGTIISMKEKGTVFIGDMLLPTDFMRIVSFQMSDWVRPARIISEKDSVYLQQSSDFAGIMGNVHRPIAAVVQGVDGLHLEIYSCKSSDATQKKGLYLALPIVSNTGKITLCSKLHDAIVYYAAAIVEESLSNAEQSKVLKATALELAGIIHNS